MDTTDTRNNLTAKLGFLLFLFLFNTHRRQKPGRGVDKGSNPPPKKYESARGREPFTVNRQGRI